MTPHRNDGSKKSHREEKETEGPLPLQQQETGPQKPKRETNRSERGRRRGRK